MASTSVKTQDTAKKARRRKPIEASPQYLEILKILERGDMPTPKQFYEFLMRDRIMAYVQFRLWDVFAYRFDKYGWVPDPPRSYAFAIALEALRAEADAEMEARFGPCPRKPRTRGRCVEL